MSTHAKIEYVDISPATAQEMLESYAWDRQRRLRSGHAEKLAIQMIKGRFTGTTIRLVYWDQHWYIVNGQHTLLAIIDAPDMLRNSPGLRPVEKGAYRPTWRLPIQRERAESEAELQAIYATTDTNLVRTVHDSLTAFDIKGILGVSSTVVNAYSSAMRFIDADFFVPRTEYDRIDLMEKLVAWAPELHLFINATTGTSLSQRVLRRDVLAVGLVTYHYIHDHRRVTGFWTAVATGNQLNQHDPRMTLRNYLLQSQGERGGSGGKSSTLTELSARITAAMWNKYWQGVPEARRINIRDHRTPMVLLGTPYTGRTDEDEDES